MPFLGIEGNLWGVFKGGPIPGSLERGPLNRELPPAKKNDEISIQGLSTHGQKEWGGKLQTEITLSRTRAHKERPAISRAAISTHSRP